MQRFKCMILADLPRKLSDSLLNLCAGQQDPEAFFYVFLGRGSFLDLLCHGDPWCEIETLAHKRSLRKARAVRELSMSARSYPKERGASSVDTKTAPQPEPWLRGTLTEINAVPRAVLHA